MATTTTAILKPESSFYSLQEINDYFAELAEVLNGKADVRGFDASAGLLADSISIINLPPPAVGEPERAPA